MHTSIPTSIRDVNQLEQVLSEPTEAAITAMSRMQGDVLLLGAGGKMGPSLARMVQRASDEANVDRRVIAVSCFTEKLVEESLSALGITTIRGDLLDEQFLKDLPNAPNVIFMTGSKFGTSSNASSTWAMNVWLPALVCRRFRESRILTFSTGADFLLRFALPQFMFHVTTAYDIVRHAGVEIGKIYFMGSMVR